MCGIKLRHTESVGKHYSSISVRWCHEENWNIHFEEKTKADVQFAEGNGEKDWFMCPPGEYVDAWCGKYDSVNGLGDLSFGCTAPAKKAVS